MEPPWRCLFLVFMFVFFPRLLVPWPLYPSLGMGGGGLIESVGGGISD